MYSVVGMFRRENSLEREAVGSSLSEALVPYSVPPPVSLLTTWRHIPEDVIVASDILLQQWKNENEGNRGGVFRNYIISGQATQKFRNKLRALVKHPFKILLEVMICSKSFHTAH